MAAPNVCWYTVPWKLQNVCNVDKKVIMNQDDVLYRLSQVWMGQPACSTIWRAEEKLPPRIRILKKTSDVCCQKNVH